MCLPLLCGTARTLFLDEPNFLDRDSLAALAGAIKDFDGGVVMITHSNQFCSAPCPEVWHLAIHTLNVKGDAERMKNAMNQVEVQAVDKMFDGQEQQRQAQDSEEGAVAC